MVIANPSAAHTVSQWFVQAGGWVLHLLQSRWTIFAGAVSVGASLTKVVPWIATKYEAWSDYRLLKRRVGADLYTREDLIRATEYYVEPDCQPTDPAGQEDFRRIAPMRSPAHRTVRNLLDPSSEQRFLILLADSGMGKTTLLMNLYARYGRKKGGAYKIVLIPLGHPKADDLITAVRDKSNTILFLDAFDEDTKAIHDYKARIATLVELSKDFSRVLMTCRTQFFETDAEIPQETGLLRIGAVRAGQSRTYTFSKLYLSPFSEAQVDRYVRKRFPFWRRKQRKRAREIVAEAPDLTMRPMLLSHIPDLITRNFAAGNAASLYQAMTEAWFLREKGLVDPEALRRFSIALARDIYTQRERRGAEKVSPAEVLTLAQELHIPLESWQMRGRSLLNRDGDGKLKFSHRSLMEYFFLVGFLEDPATCPKVPWTDQMKRFWWDMLATRYYQNHSDPEHAGLVRDFYNARTFGDPSNLATLGLRAFVTEYGYGHLHATAPPQEENKPIPYIGPLQLEKICLRAPFRLSAKKLLSTGYLPGLSNLMRPSSRCVVDLALGLLWPASLFEVRRIDLESLELGGWRIPSLFEAASLRPSRDPVCGDSRYPRDLFDDWQDLIWVRDVSGNLRLFDCTSADQAPQGFMSGNRAHLRLVKKFSPSELKDALPPDWQTPATLTNTR
jgi:hypothetical protein